MFECTLLITEVGIALPNALARIQPHRYTDNNLPIYVNLTTPTI